MSGRVVTGGGVWQRVLKVVHMYIRSKDYGLTFRTVNIKACRDIANGRIELSGGESLMA